MKVRTSQVSVHPINKRIRGRIESKSTLIDSMSVVGQANEIVCVQSDDSSYLAIDGGSRLSAAIEAGVKEIEISVRPPMSDDEIRRYILATSVRSPFPDIILGDSGEVVGGMCLAVVDELESGVARVDVAKAYGMSPDIVSAYRYLCSDIIEIKQAVATGRLSMTVYSRMKRKSDEFKKEMSERDGDLTYDVVRKAGKKSAPQSAESGEEYTFNGIDMAVRLRDMAWEMSAHSVPDDAIPFLAEARELINQLIGGRA